MWCPGHHEQIWINLETSLTVKEHDLALIRHAKTSDLLSWTMSDWNIMSCSFVVVNTRNVWHFPSTFPRVTFASSWVRRTIILTV